MVGTANNEVDGSSSSEQPDKNSSEKKLPQHLSAPIEQSTASSPSERLPTTSYEEEEEEEEEKQHIYVTDTNTNWQEQYECLLELSSKSLGKLHSKSMLRQLGGLMFVLGIGSAFSTMALIATIVDGMAGEEQIEGFLLPIFVGNLLQLGCGLTSMACGFVALVFAPFPSQKFHKFVKFTTAIVNLGPIAVVITLLRICQGASDPPEFNQFIPYEMNPTQSDIRFCAAMGALVLISVCCSLIGGLTVLGLHMCAIMGGQPHSRHKAYHRIRLVYYCLLVLVGGFSQTLLGIYLWIQFGFGPYPDPVHVPTYTVHFPLVSILVGVVQLAMGFFGIFYKPKGKYNQKDDNRFLHVITLTWIVTTILQVVFQPSYGDNVEYNAEPATVAAVYLGFFTMPAFLDYLVRNTPIQPNPEYYGLSPNKCYKEDFLTKIFKMVPVQNSNNKHYDDNVKHASTAMTTIDGHCNSNAAIEGLEAPQVELGTSTAKRSMSAVSFPSSLSGDIEANTPFQHINQEMDRKVSETDNRCIDVKLSTGGRYDGRNASGTVTATSSSDGISMSNVSGSSFSMFFDEPK